MEAAMIEAIKSGHIPSDLETKAAWLTALTELDTALPPATAMLLVAAKTDNFQGDISGWLKWSEEKFGYTGSHRSHLFAIGTMLLNAQVEDIKLFRRLLPLAQDKQYKLAGLEIDAIAELVGQYKVEDLSREQVRLAVDRWPKIVSDEELAAADGKKSRQAAQPDLPGLEESVEALVTGKGVGLDVMRLGLRTPERARDYIKVGFGFVGTAAEYMMKAPTPDIEAIAATAAKLEAAARQLREFNESVVAKLEQGA